MIDVIEAKTKKQMREFAKFPCELYEGNPYYVPSILGDDINMKDPKKNFNVQYCDVKCFLAYKDGKLAGRIAGIIHNKSNASKNAKYIRFSRFDCIDDFEVCDALLRAVANFGREHGMEMMHGPWGFNDTDREGMLIEGFDKRATYATLYNYDYYPRLIGQAGFTKESEWSEYKFVIPDVMDEKILHMAEFVENKYGLRDITYEMPFKRFVKLYRDEFFDVFNACYRHLDNFVDIEGDEKKNIMSQFATIINPRYFSAIVNKNNELVAFGIVIPSIAEALIKSRGHYSLGLVRSIMKPKELECALVGVRPDYMKRGVGVLMVKKILKNIIEDGIKDVESNPMLTTNSNIRSYFSHFEFTEAKRRCTFSKKI